MRCKYCIKGNLRTTARVSFDMDFRKFRKITKKTIRSKEVSLKYVSFTDYCPECGWNSFMSEEGTMIGKVFYDHSTFGITQRSLKMLRDELALRFFHEVVVWEIPTSDIVCGFLILDKTTNAAVFSGNGFRTDNGGEGGAGYRAAQALFAIYGINVMVWDMPVDLLAGEAVEKQLLELARELDEEEEIDIKPVQSYDQSPNYIDHC